MVTEIDKLRGRALGLATLGEFDFTDGPFRVWTGFGALTTNDGRVWQPVGAFGSIEVITTSDAVEAHSLVIGINRIAADGAAIDTAVFNDAVRAERRRQVYRRAVTLYSQVFDEQTMQPIGLPRTEFAGIMSHIETSRDGRSFISIAIHAENIFGEGRKPAFIHYTDGDQKARFLGDRAFELIPLNADKLLVWPRD